MKTAYVAIIAALGISLNAQATLIGYEPFDTDGLIAGQTGGTGFGWDNVNSVMTTTISDWDNTGATPSVTGGQLITNDSSAKREYNGDLEGSGGGDAPNSERNGAIRDDTGVVYYSVTMTRSPGADWGGISSFDFGDERVFFGVPGSQGANKFFGIVESNVGTTLSTVPVVDDGRSYTLLTKLDFDNDLLSLWVDPLVGGEGSNAPAITRAYTAGNWSTAARLGSGGSTNVAWDELRIGTTWDDVAVGLVPEPGSLAFLALGAALLLATRRKA